MDQLSEIDQQIAANIAAGNAIEGVDLTDKQIERYIEVVSHTARMRSKMLGEDFHDVDFAMGAAVVLFATGKNGKVPPAWIYNAMRGVPIFDKAD